MWRFRMLVAAVAALAFWSAAHAAANDPKPPAPIIVVPQATIPWMEQSPELQGAVSWNVSNVAEGIVAVRMGVPASILSNSTLLLNLNQARVMASFPTTLTQVQLTNQGVVPYAWVTGDPNPLTPLPTPSGKLDVFFKVGALTAPGKGIVLIPGIPTSLSIGVPIYRNAGGVLSATGYWLVGIVSVTP